MFNSKSLIAATLLLCSGGASAALMTTTIQSQSYSGTAGISSNESGANPLTFLKFDETLGNLVNVFMRADFSISGGLIGADNVTNQEVGGTGELGANISVTSSMPLFNSAYQMMFETVELSQFTNFILVADPTLSTGGNGLDVVTLYGGAINTQVDWQSVGAFFVNDYIGQNQQFNIDFNTVSIVNISAPGAQGFFQSPDFSMNIELYYEYDPTEVTTTPNEVPTDVTGPAGLAIAGMSLMLLGANRRKNQKK